MIGFYPPNLTSWDIDVLRTFANSDEHRGTRWGQFLADVVRTERLRRVAEDDPVEVALPELDLKSWTMAQIAEGVQIGIDDVGPILYQPMGELIYQALRELSAELRFRLNERQNYAGNSRQ